MRAYERLLRYASVTTDSSDTTGTSPSTEGQWNLARQLVQELESMGLSHVRLSEFGIVMAEIPATAGCETAPTLGLIAHMDTAPAFSGVDVQPILHHNYDGGDIVLPREGRTILAKEFPELKGWVGRTVITADGSTLLGADDKAGIAEIMTLCQSLMEQPFPHGKICIAFTPDEEIGEGTDHFAVADFGADFAYTVDGGLEGEIEYENFNAASAKIAITGVSVHPGYAKDVMENALLIAMELNRLLPENEIPGKTNGYEGFFHLDDLSGSVAYATMEYIIRDHDRQKFEERKQQMQQAVETVRQAHPKAVIELSLQDSYYNMQEKLVDCMHLIDNAKRATAMAGVQPVVCPIRGGTDGARLSYMGLPCPNLGTGGINFHGPLECISAEGMDTVVEILKNIISLYANL